MINFSVFEHRDAQKCNKNIFQKIIFLSLKALGSIMMTKNVTKTFLKIISPFFSGFRGEPSVFSGKQVSFRLEKAPGRSFWPACGGFGDEPGA